MTHNQTQSDHAPRWDTNSIFKHGWGCAVCGHEATLEEALQLDNQHCACLECGLTWSESRGFTYCPRCDSENVKIIV